MGNCNQVLQLEAPELVPATSSASFGWGSLVPWLHWLPHSKSEEWVVGDSLCISVTLFFSFFLEFLKPSKAYNCIDKELVKSIRLEDPGDPSQCVSHHRHSKSLPCCRFLCHLCHLCPRSRLFEGIELGLGTQLELGHWAQVVTGPGELSSLLEDSSGMLLFETGQTDPGNPELNNDVDVLNMIYMLSASFKYCVGDGQFRYR